MPKLDEQISSLETRLKQLKARQQRIEARARTLASRRERQEDTRRKVLVGAAVLARVDRDQLDHADLKSWMDAYLTKPADRALFGLPPRESPGTDGP
jgi:molecular chaperone GrpE (heat shock protein)